VIHREHALQRQIKWFVERAVAVEHLFMCHDRGRARSHNEHAWEFMRGILSGWPDTELALNGGRTFRCELKANGRMLQEDSAQNKIITRLKLLGHNADWADSVMAYGIVAERNHVPLKKNWKTLAQLADERVAADIRVQEAKAAKVSTTDPPLFTGRSRVHRTPSRAQIQRIFDAIKPEDSNVSET